MGDRALDLPVTGSVYSIQSLILAKGDSASPLGLKSSVFGNVKGNSASDIGTASCMNGQKYE